MLTKRQARVLQIVDERIRATSIAPTIREIMGTMGGSSTSGVSEALQGLEAKGFIRRSSHQARAIEILKLPANLQTQATLAERERCASIADKMGSPTIAAFIRTGRPA